MANWHFELHFGRICRQLSKYTNAPLYTCMASNTDFVQYIIDQCSGAGEIAVKKMMGDYCIYCDGVLFGLICDNNLYIKMTDAGEAVLDEVILRPPYPSARDHFYISNVDDRDYLEDIIRATLPELMSSKSKAKRKRD